nr:hypothetical protein [uncultured Arsenicibacter sp.]
MKTPVSIGIEQEFFVTKQQTVPTRADIDQLFQRLALVTGGRVKKERSACAGALLIPTATGLLSIKTDGYTHVLEIAFPPFNDFADFQSQYRFIWRILSSVLNQSGFPVIPAGLYPFKQEAFIPYPSSAESLSRQFLLADRLLPDKEFASAGLSTLMSSTHVHFGVNPDERYQWLQGLYGYEYLIPWLFSSSSTTTPDKQPIHCIRPLIYRDSFDDDYLAVAYPENIPASKEEYDRMLHQTAGFIRDYTFIAPHKLGTLEFRTACAQANFTSVLQLVMLRVLVREAVMRGFRSHVPAQKAHFYQVCQYGERGLSPLAYDDLNDLMRILSALPKGYSRQLQPLLAWAKYRCEEAQHRHKTGRLAQTPENLTI